MKSYFHRFFMRTVECFVGIIIVITGILINDEVMANAPASTEPSASALLRRWNSALLNISNSKCVTEQLESVNLPWMKGQPTWNFQREQYWRDADGRFAWKRQSWDLASEDAKRDPANALHEIVIYDLNRLYAFDEVRASWPQGFRNLTIKDHPDLKLAHAAALGLWAEGAFDDPDSVPLPEFLLSDHFKGSLKVENLPAVVNGAECLVIEATGRFGVYKIWIDTRHGFHPARIELRQKTGDETHGAKFPLPPPSFGAPSIVGCEMTYEVTHFLQIGKSWQVGGAKLHQISECKNGMRSTVDRTLTRVVDLNPDFNKAHPFEVRFPNGTKVLGQTDVPGPKLWKDGKIVPKVDQKTLGAIDRGIDQIKNARN